METIQQPTARHPRGGRDVIQSQVEAARARARVCIYIRARRRRHRRHAESRDEPILLSLSRGGYIRGPSFFSLLRAFSAFSGPLSLPLFLLFFLLFLYTATGRASEFGPLVFFLSVCLSALFFGALRERERERYRSIWDLSLVDSRPSSPSHRRVYDTTIVFP